MLPLVVSRNPTTNSLKSKQSEQRSAPAARVRSAPTNFAIVIDVERFVDGGDHMLDFIHVARAQVSIAFQHLLLRHLAAGTPSLEWIMSRCVFNQRISAVAAATLTCLSLAQNDTGVECCSCAYFTRHSASSDLLGRRRRAARAHLQFVEPICNLGRLHSCLAFD